MEKPYTYAERKYIKKVIENAKFKLFENFRDRKIDYCMYFCNNNYFCVGSDITNRSYNMKFSGDYGNHYKGNKIGLSIDTDVQGKTKDLIIEFPELDHKKWIDGKFFRLVCDTIRNVLKQYQFLECYNKLHKI